LPDFDFLVFGSFEELATALAVDDMTAELLLDEEVGCIGDVDRCYG
jgi:hypothetical protein